MRTKWFKRGDKWNKVQMTDDEEKSLELGFVDDYLEIFNNIQEKVSNQDLTDDQKFNLSLEIFKKLASPGHFKLERIMEERRDEAIAGN